MNENIFIGLLCSFLNSDTPVIDTKPDWNEIYRLSEMHNVIAIIANEANLLPNEMKPDKELSDIFKQQLGYTIIDSDSKKLAADYIEDLFNSNNIDYLFIKGAAINALYPVSQFRTSGDIDVVIRSRDIKKCKELADMLAQNGEAEYISSGDNREIDISINGTHIEIHCDDQLDNNYFKDIFALSYNDNGNKYYLDNTLQLVYTICHIAKHFKHKGAGIRMFMDIDVLARHCDIDKAIDICTQLGYEKFALNCLSMCKYWFKTPISINYDIADNTDLLMLFENEVLRSGTFGTIGRSKSDYYIISGTDRSKNYKLGALGYYLFPSIKQMRLRYRFLDKYSFLLPVAWIMRIISAIFKRKSLGTMSQIINPNDETKEYLHLIKELDI